MMEQMLHTLTKEKCGFDIIPLSTDTLVVDIRSGQTRSARAADVNIFMLVWDSFRAQLGN